MPTLVSLIVLFHCGVCKKTYKRLKFHFRTWYSLKFCFLFRRARSISNYYTRIINSNRQKVIVLWRSPEINTVNIVCLYNHFKRAWNSSFKMVKEEFENPWLFFLPSRQLERLKPRSRTSPRTHPGLGLCEVDGTVLQHQAGCQGANSVSCIYFDTKPRMGKGHIGPGTIVVKT